MKDLKECLEESLNQSINEGIKGVKPADEKLFWKWVKDLGEADIMDVIRKDEEDFYKKVADLGTTAEQFEKFSDIFMTIANIFGDIIEDTEADFGSDDSTEYATWAVPFNGEKAVLDAIKKKSTSLCGREGEEVGYAMDPDTYEEYLEDNDIEPKGYK